ncbi:peptidase C39 family protein [Terrabacter aerolatus]|uniref:peptidase C39 family protein n=1 Tax=Terrabacter aerolatus TaxID=422442 RepID=UPI0011BE1725|nr:peptidase C39 family protein [Terrabacter aerolatus]
MTERHAILTVWESGFDWSPGADVDHTDVHVEGAVAVTFASRVWESPVVELPFAATELIPSWNARTPAGTWLLVEGRVGEEDVWGPWFTFARWAEDDPTGESPVTRTTVRDQHLESGRVETDTWLAAPGHGVERWQLRLTALALPCDEIVWPTVTLVAGAASRFDIRPDEPTSVRGVGRGSEVAVPPHSQRLHVDTFPEWDNGGQSWCSPTSTTMLLEHWGRGPEPDEVAWVGHAVDPEVVHAVRRVFDRAYGGAGNWAFNTAYAGSRGLRAYVTRLRDLGEAEAFVAAGVPLVVSVTFREDELDGAGYATSGHLLTIVGFTAEGDVVSNDPNSHRIASNDEVRTVYAREQFERVWLGSDGGLAYVMHPRDVALPAPPSEPNWV